MLDGTWSVDQLRTVLNEAGNPVEENRTACEMYADRRAGEAIIAVKKTVGTKVELNDAQLAVLRNSRPMRTRHRKNSAIVWQRPAPGKTGRRRPSRAFRQSSHGRPAQPKSRVCVASRQSDSGRTGTLSRGQLDFLFEGYREEFRWRQTVGELFVKSQEVKYPGRASTRPGAPFWWMYEYVFNR